MNGLMQEPMAVSINEAARLLSVCRATIDKMIREGRLETRKIGTSQQARRLVLYASLKRLLAGEEAA